jgi:hypothetical protein
MQLTAPQQVLPTLTVDSKNRLVAVVVSEEIIGVCMKRLGEEALTAESYMSRLHQEPWGTLIRQHDGVYFITIAGLLPSAEDPRPELLAKPDNMEAVHMAIEIGLASWPEWGGELRTRFTPKPAVHVHLVGSPIQA